MGIENKFDGKVIEARPAELDLLENLHAEGRIGHPATLLGDADLRTMISIVSQLALKVAAVEYLRIIFKEYSDGMYLLLIPLLMKMDPEELQEIKRTNPNIYKLQIQRGAPVVTGMTRLFQGGGIPLREDQWYFCKATAIKDDKEGYAVALNWTDPRVEPRDILKERRMRAEASKRRRERKKQLGSSGDGVAGSKEE